jgi:membrane-associated phospholipid phosphatase
VFRDWWHLKFRNLIAIGLALSLLLNCHQASADDIGTDAGKFASGTGATLFAALGMGLPLLRDGREAKTHTLRALDTYLTSSLVAEGLKSLVKEKRPNSDSHDSLPSGHTTVAFALATMEGSFHPKEAPLWYAGATLIAISRVTLHDHNIGDVVAGAGLGWGISRLELSSKRGLILSPFISPDRRGFGLQFRSQF